jgi:hypothetical protein
MWANARCGVEIKKYKPKIHRNPNNCTDDCEKDCNMECDICSATPWDTKFYYIIQGQNNNPQFCEKCYQELVTWIKKEGTP